MCIATPPALVLVNLEITSYPGKVMSSSESLLKLATDTG